MCSQHPQNPEDVGIYNRSPNRRAARVQFNTVVYTLLAGCFVLATVITALWVITQSTSLPQNFFFETADGIYLSGKTYGQSDTTEIILLHSAYSDSNEWDVLIDAWAQHNWQLTTLDLRGHGQSLGKKQWTQIPADVAAWFAARDAKACTVMIGASFGGNVASQVINSEVDGLVLLSPGITYFEVTLAEPPPTLPSIEVYDVADDYAVFTANARQQTANVTRISDDISGHGVQLLGNPETLELLTALLETKVPCLNS